MSNNLFNRTEVKGSHLVPKFILNNFSHNKKQLHTYDVTDSRILVLNINDACTQNKFYDYKNEEHSLENLYCEIETHTAPIIKKIQENGFTYKLTNIDISWLIVYRIVQVIRNPRFISAVMNLHQQILDIEVDRYLHTSEAQKLATEFGLSPEMLEELKKGGAKDELIESLVRDRSLDAMVTNICAVSKDPQKYSEQLQFILFYNTKGTFIINDIGVAVSDQQQNNFYLPLSPNLLLYTESKTNKDFPAIIKLEVQDETLIKEINFITKSCALRFIFANSKDLLT